MAGNHYTKGVTTIDKDTFDVGGITVKRRYPRREGTHGGVAQAYTIDGKIVGYTLEDVKAVVAARKQTTPEPALSKALDSLAKMPCNARPAESLEPLIGNVARLVEAAQEAAEWLVEAHPGSDQHQRGVKLAKALKPFTN